MSIFDTSFFMNLALLSATNVFANTRKIYTAMTAYTLVGMACAQFIGLVDPVQDVLSPPTK